MAEINCDRPVEADEKINNAFNTGTFWFEYTTQMSSKSRQMGFEGKKVASDEGLEGLLAKFLKGLQVGLSMDTGFEMVQQVLDALANCGVRVAIGA